MVVVGGGGVRTKFSVQLWSQAEQYTSFETAKYFESKTFGPPFLRHRVKYGGLDK